MHRLRPATATARRYASTAATSAVRAGQTQVPPPTVPVSAFPESVGKRVSPDHLASITPAPPAAFAALAARLRLPPSIPLEKLEQACTHPSIRSLGSRFPHARTTPTNANLETLGNSLLGLFASEFLHAAYPHLPLRALKAAVSAAVGSATCARVASEIGASHLARWHRATGANVPAVLHHDALASIPRALAALVYTHASLPAARDFAHALFLSRDLDLRPLLKFRDPKLALIETVAKFERERPVSRLLAETGRASAAPMFVVGVYSGADKLGEGFGSSLKMAEYRAAEDALHRLYLTRIPTPDLERSIPSHTFLPGDVFERSIKGQEQRHVPAPLGMSEIKLDAAGRTGRVVPVEERAPRVRRDREDTWGRKKPVVVPEGNGAGWGRARTRS